MLGFFGVNFSISLIDSMDLSVPIFQRPSRNTHLYSKFMLKSNMSAIVLVITRIETYFLILFQYLFSVVDESWFGWVKRPLHGSQASTHHIGPI